VKLQWIFLRSKVEKQLFGLFLSCALFPIVVLSALSFDHVTKQLYAQSRARLHQASKATGMALVQRIAELENELAEVIEAGILWGRPEELPGHHFRSIDATLEDGKRAVWFGKAIELPELSPAERAHLAGGKPLLLTAHGADGPPKILLAKVFHRNGAAGTVTVEIDRDFLFDITRENTLPPMAEFCVLDARDRPLACTLPEAEVLEGLGEEHPVSGQFEWEHEKANQLAYFWSVFLKPNFHTPQWTVVLSEPEDEVLAPIRGFQSTFPFAVLLSIFVITLMCVNQIRRRLVPLKQLRDGTQRVAERDFDVDVRVDSGDEFQELADSFNTMARRLGEQFESLGKMIDIDRAILSAIDRDKIVNTLIARLRELYPCDSIAVSLFDPSGSVEVRTQFSQDADAGSQVIDSAGLAAIEERQLGANAESLLLDLGEDSPR